MLAEPHGAEEIVDVPLHQRIFTDALGAGAQNYLVVHIGEVLNVLHLVADVFQIAAQHIKYDVAQSVSYVSRRIGSHAANVHFDRLTVGGNELVFLAGQGVVKLHIRSISWTAC